MKRLRFKFVVSTLDEQVVLQDENLLCSDAAYEAQYALAKEQAYNGEVTVEEVEDEETAPTQFDTIEAQVTYTAMMTDTLLEG